MYYHFRFLGMLRQDSRIWISSLQPLLGYDNCFDLLDLEIYIILSFLSKFLCYR